MQPISVFRLEARRFGRDRRGNIAVTFALVCLPLLYVIGCAVDCTHVAALRRQLQAAANAASAGSVAKIAPGLLAALVMASDGPVAIGGADAADIFRASMSGVTGYALDSMVATMTKRGATVTSEVSFSVHVPTAFLRVIGWPDMTVSGGATATAKLPRFIDIYVSPWRFAGADLGGGNHRPKLR
jgi:Flp pilus assembly protein TadG